MRGWDSLVLPQIGGLKVHGLWVSSSESLSNPGVVKLLSITELEESGSSADEASEAESAEALVQVNVEVVWSSLLPSHEIGESEPSTHQGERSGLDATNQLEVVAEIKEVQIEQLRVVLDKLDWSNFFRQGGIILLGVSWVSVN